MCIRRRDSAGDHEGRSPSPSSTSSPSSSAFVLRSTEKAGGADRGAGGRAGGRAGAEPAALSLLRRRSLSQRLARARSVRTQTYNYVLGVSSLWLLWPAGHGCYRAFVGEDGSALALLLTAAAIVTAFVSAAMWQNKRPGSKLFKADIAAACTTMLLLVLRSSFGDCRPVTLAGKLAFPALVAVPWTVTCVASARSLHLLAFVSHNAFRYVGCWWTYYSLEARERSFLFTFVFFSVMYAVHIAFSIYVAERRMRIREQAHVCTERYAKGCAELVAYVAACAAAHTLYNRYGHGGGPY